MGHDGVTAASPPTRVASSPARMGDMKRVSEQSRYPRHASPLTGRYALPAPLSGGQGLGSTVRLPLLTALLRGGSPAHTRAGAHSPHHGGTNSPRRPRAHSARAGHTTGTGHSGGGYSSARCSGSPAAQRPATPRSLRHVAVLAAEGLSVSQRERGESSRPQSPRVNASVSTPRASNRPAGGASPLVVHLAQQRCGFAWPRQETPRRTENNGEHTPSQYAAPGLGLHTPLRGASPPTPYTGHKQRTSGGGSSGLNSSADTVGHSDTPSPIQPPATPTSAPRRAPSPQGGVWSTRGREQETERQQRQQRSQRALSAHAGAGRSGGVAEQTRLWIQELTEAARNTPPTTPSGSSRAASRLLPQSPSTRQGHADPTTNRRASDPSVSSPLHRWSSALSASRTSMVTSTPPSRVNDAAATPATPGTPVAGGARRAAHVPSSISNMVCTWTANGQEDQGKYGAGGYFRVRAGDVLKGRYHIVCKLGWGEFATVWLAWDSETLNLPLESPCKQFVALKISKCAPHVANATRDEAALLGHICHNSQGHGAHSLGRMTEVFNVAGEHGEHVAMVFPVLGQNILCLVEQAHRHREKVRQLGLAAPKRAPEEVRFVKACLRATLRGLSEMHRLQIVHTDLKPENILLTAVSQKIRNQMRSWQEEFERTGRVSWDPKRLVSTSSSLPEEEREPSYVRISDFGLSSLLDPSHQELGCGTHARRLQVKRRGVASNPLGVVLQTREYRAPEVLFGSYIGVGSDVWSVGCMAYELTTGTFLMDPKRDPKRRPKPEEEINADHLCMMQQIIGPIPGSVARGSGRHLPRYFDSEGRFRFKERADQAFPRRSLKAELAPFLGENDAAELAHFIQSCLMSFDPFQRPTADQLLKHNFVRA
eukprot:Hpha_TRINITY_DN15443_c2_g8::TRINITY_DN15443_c2_g8_i1::g.173982::m.173982/K08832/SRPK3, STK23; serine/threonine-protein kinase SRPK3